MDSQYINCPKCGTRNFASDKICGVCKGKLINQLSSKNERQARAQPTNYKVILTTLGIILFIYIAFFKEDKINNSSSVDNKYSSPRSFSKGYLLTSVQEFKDNFNSFSQTYNLGLKISKINIQEGQINNSFMYKLDQHVGLIGSLNKRDNSIQGIIMIGQGDGSLNSGVDIISTMLCIIGSVDPTLSGSERRNIMEKLGFLDNNADLYNMSNSTIKNGIKYFINSSHQIGITCGAKIPN